MFHNPIPVPPVKHGALSVLFYASLIDQTQQTQSRKNGLLTGLLKFASSENTSNSQTVQQQQISAQHNQRGFNQQNTQGPNQGPHLSNRASAPHAVQQETSKPGFIRQQTVPLQQTPSQQSGLFKFASADNTNAQQQTLAQQQVIMPSRSICSTRNTHSSRRTKV